VQSCVQVAEAITKVLNADGGGATAPAQKLHRTFCFAVHLCEPPPLAGGQVAEVIKKVLTAEGPPHLRNITSKQAKRLAAHKYNDLNGDKTLAAVQDFMEKVCCSPLLQINL